MLKKLFIMSVFILILFGSSIKYLSAQETYLCGIVSIPQDSVTIRQYPSIVSPIVGLAAQGSALRILKITTGWYYVQLNNGKKGYGSSEYIQEITPKRVGSCGVVTTKNAPLNVRQEAKLGAKLIMRASPGSALRILDTLGQWYQVRLNPLSENGKELTGYASRHYIQIVGPSIDK
jgi:uncharacterized protein YgiM (DUF1202 family)